WKSAVGVAKQIDHLATHGPVQWRSDYASHAVAGIHDYFQTPRSEPDVRRDVRAILGDDIELFFRPGTERKSFVHLGAFFLQNLLAKNSALVQTDLKAVVVRRIVTPGDHHSCVDGVAEQGEVQNRRRHHSNIHNTASRFVQPANHDVAKAR